MRVQQIKYITLPKIKGPAVSTPTLHIPQFFPAYVANPFGYSREVNTLEVGDFHSTEIGPNGSDKPGFDFKKDDKRTANVKREIIERSPRIMLGEVFQGIQLFVKSGGLDALVYTEFVPPFQNTSPTDYLLGERAAAAYLGLRGINLKQYEGGELTVYGKYNTAASPNYRTGTRPWFLKAYLVEELTSLRKTIPINPQKPKTRKKVK